MAHQVNFPGSKWWSFDFHSHTPASADYGQQLSEAEKAELLPKNWLLNYMRAGIDCVAVTDHDSGEWIDLLKDALENLMEVQPEGYRPLYLFPGVEITVHGGVHLLAIFDSTKTKSEIDSLLGAVGYLSEGGQSNAVTTSPFGAVVEEINKRGGLAIPAHVDCRNGLFEVFSGQTLLTEVGNAGILAVEIRDPDWEIPQNIQPLVQWANVLGSDAHNPPGYGAERFPGSHYTWVKMAEPSIEGLKLALTDGEQSLIRSDRTSRNPNTTMRNMIEEISINNARYLGRGEPLTIRFNPWLNTVIGGRGTGKSSSIEFLRLALDQWKGLPDALEYDLKKYKLKSQSRKDSGLLTKDSEISVVFLKDSTRYKCIWKAEPGNHTIKILKEGEEPEELTDEILRLFPVRIYSQKQIFELAKNPQHLLEIIDADPRVNLSDWERTRQDLENNFLANKGDQRGLVGKLALEGSFKAELQEKNRNIEILDEHDHENKFKNFAQRKAQDQEIRKWEESLEASLEQFHRFIEAFKKPSLNSDIFGKGIDGGQELLQKLAEIENGVSGAVDDMKKIYLRITEMRDRWIQGREELSIIKAIKNSENEIAELRSAVDEHTPVNPSTYKGLLEAKVGLEKKLEEVARAKEQLSALKSAEEKCLTDLEAHYRLRTAHRESFVEEILADDPSIRITFDPLGDEASLERNFRELLQIEDDRFARDILDRETGEGLLAPLAGAEKNDKYMALKSLKQNLIALHETGNCEHVEIKDNRFIQAIQRLAPEQIDRLRAWFPDDGLKIEYQLPGMDTFRPIDQASPGQMTASLLTFILSYGEEPLILDQPEDDLDNSLIYGLVVEKLRKIKNQRQVLIVTHNANIVVNGNAENVIVLNNRGGRTNIAQQGGIEDAAVRDEICDVLEGGPEAFEQRYRRINA